MNSTVRKALAGSAAACAGLYSGMSMFLTHEIFDRNAVLADTLCNRMPSDPLPNQAELDEIQHWTDSRNYEETVMKNSRGQYLKGFLLRPEKKSDVYVLCSHGYRSTGKIGFRYIAKYWHEKGFNVFIVDQQAEGESEGDILSFGYYESQDMLEWVRFLVNEYGGDIKIIMHGVSLGCATVNLTVGSDYLPSNVKFVVSDCGYTSCEDEFEYLLKSYKMPKTMANSIARVAKAKYGFDFRYIRPVNALRKAKMPILFIHGGDDSFVPTFMVNDNYNACTSEKKLLIIEGAGHAASYQTDPEKYEAACNEYCEKYL